MVGMKNARNVLHMWLYTTKNGRRPSLLSRLRSRGDEGHRPARTGTFRTTWGCAGRGGSVWNASFWSVLNRWDCWRVWVRAGSSPYRRCRRRSRTRGCEWSDCGWTSLPRTSFRQRVGDMGRALHRLPKNKALGLIFSTFYVVSKSRFWSLNTKNHTF